MSAKGSIVGQGPSRRRRLLVAALLLIMFLISALTVDDIFFNRSAPATAGGAFVKLDEPARPVPKLVKLAHRKAPLVEPLKVFAARLDPEEEPGPVAPGDALGGPDEEPLAAFAAISDIDPIESVDEGPFLSRRPLPDDVPGGSFGPGTTGTGEPGGPPDGPGPIDPPTGPPNPTIVPEPSTWFLTIIGFGVAGGLLRRRRRFGFAPHPGREGHGA